MTLTPERRVAMLVGVVVLGVALLGASVVAIFLTLGAQQRQVQRARTDRMEQDLANTASQRKDRIITHGQCLTLNDGRRRARAYSEESVRLTYESVLPGQPPFTPEQQVAVDKLAAAIRAAGRSILPDVDCDKVTPLPPNMTAAERGRLPKPEPIVIPGQP